MFSKRRAPSIRRFARPSAGPEREPLLPRKALTVRGPLALALLAGSLSSCIGSSLKSWRVQPPPPAGVVVEQHPNRIRVLRADNTRVVLRSPSIIGDSLVAMDAEGRRIAMPLTQVTQMEVEKTNGRKVAFVVVATAAGVAWMVSLLGKAAATGY